MKLLNMMMNLILMTHLDSTQSKNKRKVLPNIGAKATKSKIEVGTAPTMTKSLEQLEGHAEVEIEA